MVRCKGMILLVTLGALGLSSLSFAGAKGQKHIGTPELMRGIHSSMVKILPHSVGAVGFSSKTNRVKIATEIGKLNSLGKSLVKDSKNADEAFKLIAANFLRDTEDMMSSFEKENYRNARFVFQNITSNCISCHTRQEGHGSKRNAPLYDQVEFKYLSLIEKAELNTSIRRFDVALTQYEKAFSKGEISKLNTILLEGYVVDYMILGLKVKNDLPRVKKTVEQLAFNPGVPISLKRVLGKWVGFINSYDPKADYSKLEKIVSLYENGQSLNTHPFDSSGAMAAILVESHLQALLSNEVLPANVKAKAYLIYGLCEISLSRPLQLSKAGYFLEKAIKAEPKSKTAKDAYSILEDHIYFEHSGSSGTSIPKELMEKLSELRKLI